jgi:predicted acyl esterase
VRILRNLLVSMSDGIRIALDVYLPDSEQRYPAVFYFMPYRKDDFYPHIGNGAALPPQYVERGFAFVLGDVRGTNDSEGIVPEMWNAQERQDGAEVVEWIAAQAWCDGNVGITGTSYGFWTSLLTAACRPPHLKAVVPLYGSVSSYYAFCEGGIPMAFGYHADYLAIMIAMAGSPPGYRDPEGRWEGLWRSRIEHYTPWGLEWLTHQADDEFWDKSSIRNFYDRIETPVFLIGGWGDRYPGDVIELFPHLKGPKKALIGPWHHVRLDMGVPGPRVDYDIVFRWFDYWLKGERNGILDEPDFTVYTQEYAHPAEYLAEIPGYWREENAWPFPGATQRRLYLNDGGALSQNPPNKKGSGEYRYDPTAGICSRLTGGIYGGIGLPVDQRPDESKSLIFTTDPLAQRVEITGLPRVRLHFSSTARVMDVIAKICDVAPDGTVSLVTRGQLNVAHREGLDKPAYLTPGTVYGINVEIKGASYAFEPGHRIRLAITSGEFQTILSTPENGNNSVYYGDEHSSFLELPVVPHAEQRHPLSLKFLPPPPQEAPKGASFHITQEPETGWWQAIREAQKEYPGLNGPVTYWQKTTSRVHPDRPSDAAIESESTFDFRHESGEEIRSHGSVRYQCDGEQIHLHAKLRVTRNGVEEFSRDWTRSYPRGFV